MTLSDTHLTTLAALGISPEFAALRGYETITDSARVAGLKIPVAARRVPGLLVPGHRKDGSVAGYQYRPDTPAPDSPKYVSPRGQTNYVDVPVGFGALLDNPAIPLWITEGAKKADCAALRGILCVSINGVYGWRGTNSSGGKTVLADWDTIALNGREVVIAFDGDVQRKEDVRQALSRLATFLEMKDARVKYLWLPDTDNKTGLDDYLIAGHTIEELNALVSEEVPPNPTAGQQQMLRAGPPTDATTIVPQHTPISRKRCHKVFLRWLGKDYDTDALDLCLAAAAVERFNDGSDPLWVLIVGGPGNAKTETLMPFAASGGFVVSSISSEAALLSATSAKDRTKTATGGLLRRMGERGLLCIKDVTSILSMDHVTREHLLSALREIYDGTWSREVGTDGGRFIGWTGRIGVVGAVTTAWDTHYSVISKMGDRFALLRIDSREQDPRRAAAFRAIRNTGDEPDMRTELAVAVGGVMTGMDDTPITLTEAELAIVADAANLTTLARTSVDYDYRGDVIAANAPEMPTRFAKQLTQVIRGAVAIGMDRAEAVMLAIRVARDSIPPLRLEILEDLAGHPHSNTQEVRKRLGRVRNTVDHQLQALHALQMLECDEDEYGLNGKVRWFYTLAKDISTSALDRKSVQEKLDRPLHLNQNQIENDSGDTPTPPFVEHFEDQPTSAEIETDPRAVCFLCLEPKDPEDKLCARCQAVQDAEDAADEGKP